MTRSQKITVVYAIMVSCLLLGSICGNRRLLALEQRHSLAYLNQAERVQFIAHSTVPFVLLGLLSSLVFLWRTRGRRAGQG